MDIPNIKTKETLFKDDSEIHFIDTITGLSKIKKTHTNNQSSEPITVIIADVSDKNLKHHMLKLAMMKF